MVWTSTAVLSCTYIQNALDHPSPEAVTALTQVSLLSHCHQQCSHCPQLSDLEADLCSCTSVAFISTSGSGLLTSPGHTGGSAELGVDASVLSTAKQARSYSTHPHPILHPVLLMLAHRRSAIYCRGKKGPFLLVSDYTSCRTGDRRATVLCWQECLLAPIALSVPCSSPVLHPPQPLGKHQAMCPLCWKMPRPTASGLPINLCLFPSHTVNENYCPLLLPVLLVHGDAVRMMAIAWPVFLLYLGGVRRAGQGGSAGSAAHLRALRGNHPCSNSPVKEVVCSSWHQRLLGVCRS